MMTKLITRDNLKKLISKVLTSFQVIAPVNENNVSFFKRISVYEEIKWEDNNPIKSPKEFFFAPSDDLFRFQMKSKSILLREPSNHHDQRIVLGIRPCDMAALNTLDRVFLEDGKDLLYSALRDNTLLIGQSCRTPGKYCFCSSVGINPDDSQNMDLMLTDIEKNVFLVRVVSEKGEKFFSHFSTFFQGPDTTTRHTPVQTKEMADYLKQGALFNVQNINEWLNENFEHPIWSEIAAKCIGCGVCTFFCPTCHCFDINDEDVVYRDSSYQGVRRRIWDSCSFDHFTKMPMHQPRPTQDRRLRQRIMHKFKYFIDRFQQGACVGCGRCRSLCPVGIDIIEVLERIHCLSYHSHGVK